MSTTPATRDLGIPLHMVVVVPSNASQIKPKHHKHGQLAGVTLRIDQRQMVRAMIKRECENYTEGLDKKKRKVRVYSTVGCLANPVGWGKTLVVLDIIMTGIFPTRKGSFNTECQSAFVQHVFLPTKPSYECTLIVIPSVLHKQWVHSFQKMAPGLDISVIASAKAITAFQPTPGKHAVIVTNTMYKAFMSHGPVVDIHWARVVYDELHTSDKLGRHVPSADFIWSLNATIPAMLNHTSQVSKTIFGSTRGSQNMGGATLCIRNSEDALATGMVLPDLYRCFIRCRPIERISAQAMNVLSAAQQDELHANAITLEELRKTLAERLSRSIDTAAAALSRANAMLTVRQSQNAGAIRIAQSQTLVAKCTTQLQTAQHEQQSVLSRFDGTLDDTCSVCFEPLVECPPSISANDVVDVPYRCSLPCDHFICLMCANGMKAAFRGHTSVLFNCPQCRVTVPTLQLVRETTGGDENEDEEMEAVDDDAPPPPQYLTKPECLVALLSHDQGAFHNIPCEIIKRILAQILSPSRKEGMRFVVAAKFISTFRKLQHELENANPPIAYQTISAGASLPHIMQRFKDGVSRVLFLKTEEDGSGLDGLQYLSTDFVMILYHKLTTTMEEQAVGRLHRYAGESTRQRKVTVISLHADDEFPEETVQAVQNAW